MQNVQRLLTISDITIDESSACMTCACELWNMMLMSDESPDPCVRARLFLCKTAKLFSDHWSIENCMETWFRSLLNANEIQNFRFHRIHYRYKSLASIGNELNAFFLDANDYTCYKLNECQRRRMRSCQLLQSYFWTSSYRDTLRRIPRWENCSTFRFLQSCGERKKNRSFLGQN